MSYHEVIFPEFFQASLAAIPVLLLGSFLNEKFIERTQFVKCTKRIYKAIIIFSIAAMTLSLINLLPIAGLQTSTPWKIFSFVFNFLFFFICACGVGALGFLRIEEAPTDEVDHEGTTELEPEAKQGEKKALGNATKRSVATPEDAQQQEPDTPEEDARKPQKEPSPTGSQNRGEPGTTGGAEERINSKEGTEGSRKPHPRKARKTGPLKRILRASKYLSRQLVQRISNSR